MRSQVKDNVPKVGTYINPNSTVSFYNFAISIHEFGRCSLRVDTLAHSTEGFNISLIYWRKQKTENEKHTRQACFPPFSTSSIYVFPP